MNKRVLIVGLGLIGGSVALGIKQQHPDSMIIGYDRSEANLETAKRLFIIDEGCTDWLEAAKDADLLLLATPVEVTKQLLVDLADVSLKDGVIITDVGSTKGSIMKAASALVEKGITFIGGHPMAGSHKSGPASAKAHLFENAFYMLTPFSDTPPHQLEQLKDWLRGTRAKFMTLDADQHDLLTGVVSHFPHIVAASLVRQTKRYAESFEEINDLAAGGFKDITRIASSSPEMWKDITKQNRAHLLTFLDEWMEEMKDVRSWVAQGDDHELYSYYAGAKEYRDALPIQKRGAIRSFYDLYVDILDDVGVLSRVTAILAENQVSITNIRIMEVREDIYGVLRISFQNEDDRQKAKNSLEALQFTTYIAL
ncbi:prephenate dehydrogenase [Fictibacillus macauensis ZFHKF-1]|uniref:Prephenate dehydrogenase n=1 Tax=Fictibacillus macauensis ZFHKF-1 TaxID=1196324 RepID=I8UIX6_9BACL|nr:prephenate dehydrogenase [Fictibacillus macauensis]EIT86783.1 prephenate dehydrogenase [Fictibacillus macauensis ZFHKF-1]